MSQDAELTAAGLPAPAGGRAPDPGPAGFGAWVRRRRKLLDLTQEALAERAALSHSAVRKIEADERRPSREAAVALADALEVPTTERAAFLHMARQQTHPAETPASTGAPVPRSAPGSVAVVNLTQSAERAVEQVSAPQRPRQPLPTPTTPLIGRSAEVTQVLRLLRAPDCRLLTMVGPGGIGKTRLALEVAHLAQEIAAEPVSGLPENVVFVELAPLTSGAFVAPAIAAAVGLAVTSAAAEPSLLAWLAQRTLLLVLDNAEHLIDGLDLLPRLLERAPGLRLLVTSREHLQLQGEWVFELQGLPVGHPGENAGDAPHIEAPPSPAVALFLQRAEQSAVGRHIGADQRPAVARICSLLGGVPLAIELAATWVRVLSLDEIGDEIARSVDFLEAQRRDLPPRHRSMRAVFDHSWRLLSERERNKLCRLAVFPSPFGREAAQVVAGAALADILALAGKSMLASAADTAAGAPGTLPAAGARYTMHTLVRQYALEQLEATGETVDTHERLFQYAVSLGQRARTETRGPAYISWLRRFDEEVETLRMALEWGLEHNVLAAVALVTDLELLWRQRSAPEVGYWLTRAMGAMAREQARYMEAGDEEQLLALRRARARLLAMAIWLDTDADQVAARAFEAEQLARDSGEVVALISVLPMVANLILRQGDLERAIALFEEAVDLSRSTGNLSLLAQSLNQQGKAERYLGRYNDARRHHGEALTIARSLGHPVLQTDATLNLNLLAMRQGNYKLAEAWVEENLSLAQQTGDRQQIAWALQSLARTLVFQAQYERAEPLLAQIEPIVRQSPDRNLIANYLLLKGDFMILQGRIDEAEATHREALARNPAPFFRGWCMRVLGIVARLRGDRAGARAYFDATIDLSRSTGEGWNRSLTEIMYANLELDEGALEPARAYLVSSAETLYQLEDKWGMARCLETTARLALMEKKPLAAARLLGAGVRLRQLAGMPLAPVERRMDTRLRTELESLLTAEDIAEAEAAGAGFVERWRGLPDLLTPQLGELTLHEEGLAAPEEVTHAV